MTNFKLNDVVIVTKNPPNQIVKIKGDIGYIDEFQETTNEKGEMNTPINKQFNWYLQNLRYG